MSIVRIDDRSVTHRQEILELLELAQSQQWDFTCVNMVKNHAVSRKMEILSIEPEMAAFGVDTNIIEEGEQNSEKALFRMFNGGLSVIFRSSPTGDSIAVDGSKSKKAHLIQLPYEMRCTQLCRAARASLDQDSDVPVIMCNERGERHRGRVVDISLCGTKFRFPGDLRGEFYEFAFIETCKIRLPDGTVMRVTANVMGLDYDSRSDETLMRCRMSKVKRKDEIVLENLIQNRLETSDPMGIPIAV